MHLGPTIISAPQFMDRVYETPPSIVEGGVLGYEALTLLTGQEGIGKSLLVMQLAYHIASGEAWLGCGVPGAHRVLLVQKELPNADLQARFRAQLAGRPAPAHLYFVETPGGVRFMGGGLGPAHLDLWIQVEKPRVLIVDPLVEFHGANENAANEVAAAVLGPVERWKAQGTSVILVHHHGKPSEEFPRSGTNRVRGSSALAGSADTNLQLIEINRDKGWYRLDFAKLRRVGPQRPIMLVRDPKTLTYQVRGVHVGVVDAVRQMGGSVPAPDLVAWMVANSHCVEVTAYKAVQRLVESGELIREGGPPPKPSVIKLPI